MSGSPTFDNEKKPRNGGILRLRLAYGRRSNNSPNEYEHNLEILNEEFRILQIVLNSKANRL